MVVIYLVDNATFMFLQIKSYIRNISTFLSIVSSSFLLLTSYFLHYCFHFFSFYLSLYCSDAMSPLPPSFFSSFFLHYVISSPPFLVPSLSLPYPAFFLLSSFLPSLEHEEKIIMVANIVHILSSPSS